jgi:hypothetical protein
MKILNLLLFSLCFGAFYGQTINYKVEIVQLKIDGCDDGFGDDEEPTWKVWAHDDINTAWQGGICQSSDGNTPYIYFPTGTSKDLLNVTNSTASSVEIKFEAWEDDNFSNAPGSADRCSFDSGDDCHELQIPLAGANGAYSAINIQTGPMCQWTDYTYVIADWAVVIRIKWEYFVFEGGPSLTACAGTPAVLDAEGSGIWSIYSGTGGGFSSNANPQAQFTGNGGETYKLLWSSLAGCLTANTADTVTVYVDVAPNPNLEADPNSFCEGATVSFDADNGLNYSFSVNNLVNVQETNVTGAYDYVVTIGDTVVYVAASDANCTGYDSLFFDVEETPVPAINFDGTTFTSNLNYPFNQWSLNGTPITGATSGNYTPVQNGNYTLEVGLLNGCTASVDYNLNNIGIESVGLLFKTYPNPANDVIYLQTNALATVNYFIYDRVGKLVDQGQFENSIDLSRLNSGMYLLRIQSGEYYSKIQKIEIIK